MKVKLALALLALAGGSAAATSPRPARTSAGEPQAALVALGRTLFFDVRLSGNRNIACGTCHYHRTGSSDGLSLAIGEGSKGAGPERLQGRGRVLGRRAPALYDRAHLESLFWDGRVSVASGVLTSPVAVPPSMAGHVTTALAAQALLPPLAPDEMRGEPGTNEVADAPTPEAAWGAIMKRLLADDHLAGLFRAAFPAERALDFGHAAVAIAAFETHQWSSRPPLDDLVARSAAGPACAGALLFTGKAGCVRCHSGPYLTDGKLHALAVPQIGPRPDDEGAGGYRFRTPPLRNTALAGAWMHDGCFTSLEAVVRHHLDPRASLEAFDASSLPPALAASYDRDPARQAARLAALDPILAPTHLEAGEVRALVSFLESLTDPGDAAKLSYRMDAMGMAGVMPSMMMMRDWDKKKAPRPSLVLTMGR